MTSCLAGHKSDYQNNHADSRKVCFFSKSYLSVRKNQQNKPFVVSVLKNR